MARIGCQEPTFSTVGEWAWSDGPEAVEMFEGYGARFLPSQAWEMSVYLARNERGRMAARTIALSKPRQNGKSYAARYYAVWMAAVEGLKVLYTAHHGKTSRKMFKAVEEIFKSHRDLRRLLKPGRAGIYRAAGSEGFYLQGWSDEDGSAHPGGAIEFQTRTNGGARGDTYDIVIVDEAQELTDEQMEALKPTTAAAESGDPQMIYLGTPPNSKCPGTVFRDMHDRAHAGTGGSAWWIEWAASEVGDPRDPERWYRCMPGLGALVERDTVADAADTMSPAGFAREFLGWWSPVSAASPAIGRPAWDALASASVPGKGRDYYAVKFSPDGASAVIAGCRRPKKGAPFVEVVEAGSCERGTGWVLRSVRARLPRAAAVWVDGGSRAVLLVDELVGEGADPDKLRRAKTADMADAAAALADAVKAGELRHKGQPGLSDCAARCPKRPIGSQGGWSFAAGAGTAPEPMEAVALALLASKKKGKKKGKGLIG